MLAALVLALAATSASAARIKWAGAQGPSAGFLAVNGGDLQNDGKAITSTNNRRLVHTNWDFSVGEETKFKINEEGANLCLDAGLQQYNGSPVKVWECLDGVPQQQWFVSNEGQFRLANTNFCVDVKDGEVTAEQLQLWQCAQGNSNQVWHTVFITNF